MSAANHGNDSLACGYSRGAAAILSKSSFIGLPIVLMVLDLWPLDRPFRRPILERSPLIAILLLAAAVQIAIFGQVSLPKLDGSAPLELFSTTMASFVTRLAWPVGLLPFVPFRNWSSVSHIGIWRDLAITALLIVLPVWGFFRCRPLFTAMAGALLIVYPAFLYAPFSDAPLGDLYLYPVLILPLVVLAAWIGERDVSFQSPFVRCAALAQIALLAVLGVHAYSQTFTWQSGGELFAATIRANPNWSPGYIGLIEATIAENDYEAALRYAKKAVGVAPEDASTQFYVGTALLLQTGSRAGEAIAPLRKALASNSNWIECLQNLGVALARCGEFEKAIEYLERARDLQPNSAGIRVGLGNSYLKVHRAASARRELQEALRLQCNSMTHLSLAVAWAANDAPDMARRHLAAAVARDPHMAARAAAIEEFRRYRDRPGFESLIGPLRDDAIGPSGEAELPAARNARGS